MTMKRVTAVRLLLLPLVLLLGLPQAWAQSCTIQTLASANFGVNETWNTNPTFTATTAGTLTLTVTGGLGGQSSMTIGAGSAEVVNPGSGSMSLAPGTYNIVAGDGGIAHAAGSYTITFTPTSCSGSTSVPAPVQQVQNQNTAVSNGQASLSYVAGFLSPSSRPIEDVYADALQASHILLTLFNTNLMTATESARTGQRHLEVALMEDPAVRDLLIRGLTDSRTFPSVEAINAIIDRYVGATRNEVGVHVFNSYLLDLQKHNVIQKMRLGISGSARLRGPTTNPALEASRLKQQEREQAETLRELRDESGGGFDKQQAADLGVQLAQTQDRLKMARLNAEIAAAHPSGRAPALQPDDTQMAGAAAMRGAGSTTPAAGPQSLSLSTRAPAGSCRADADSCDSDPSKPSPWNAWLEGRAMGSRDSVLQNNAVGFLGFGGVGYQAMPWLMTGLSVGAETFRTAYTSGVGSTTLGFSVVPYAGIRLDKNIQAAAFAGFTSIAYNTNPGSGVSAQFNAQRFMVGGALTGTWHDGFWRFQPSLEATYGTENQNAYTDSVGTYVSGQRVFYGRIGAGPEIGYTFVGPTGEWRLEPFVLAKINLNIASDTLAVVNNAPVVVRPGTLGSGSLGGGVNLMTKYNASLRFQGSYDSIGVIGLDIWSAVLRGSLAF